MSATVESGGPIRVLHVDDEPDLAEMTTAFLKREIDRIEVEHALSVSDGLDTLTATHIDCVISDYDMPGENGIEFLETVREKYPDLPFILYTGKGSEEVASEAISAGVTDYLQKGRGTSQYQILANRIRNAVEKQKVRQIANRTEEQLRKLAESTDDILWLYTADWEDLLFINSAYETLWDRPIEELREHPPSFQKGVHPDDRSITREGMEMLSAGESIDIEFRVNESEDFGRWVWVKGEPIFDDRGNVKWVAGFARDITERKQREQELQRFKDKHGQE